MTSIGRVQFPILPRSPKPLGGPSLQKSEILWEEKALCAVILPFKMCLAQRLSTILLLCLRSVTGGRSWILL